MDWDGTCFRQKLIVGLKRRQSQKWEMKNDELELGEGEDGEDHPFAFGRVQGEERECSCSWNMRKKRDEMEME
jgi:hypothetical protein